MSEFEHSFKGKWCWPFKQLMSVSAIPPVLSMEGQGTKVDSELGTQTIGALHQSTRGSVGTSHLRKISLP